MFHAVDLIVNEATGVPMSDVKVRLFDPVTGAAIPIYQDESATPFDEANTALTDKGGVYDFWVSDGIWDQKFYVGEALLRADDKLAFNGTLADLASTADSKGAALVGFLQSGTGATPRTAEDKLRELVTPADFGAATDYQLVFVTGSMTAGGNVLSLTAPLAVGVTPGMLIFVDGAGPGGEQLITSILAVNTGRTQLTLTDPAVRAITAKSLILEYGSDNTAALTAFADFCYESDQSGYVPPNPSGVWLVTDTINFRQSLNAETNVREAAMSSIRIDAGATIKWANATGAGKAVIRYGADDTYDQLLRGGALYGGSIDCSMVAETGVDIPFAIDTFLHDFQIIDVARDGFKIGDTASAATSGAVTIDSPRIIRSTLGRALTITNITKATEAVVTVADYNWDDGRVITIADCNMPEANGAFVKIARLTQNTFKLVGVNSTAWTGTFSGTATATACMPSMRVSWALSAVTKASPAVVTLTQAPAEANGTRVEFHAVDGMTELEGATAYTKAVVGQPTKYELYSDVGLTTAINSTAYTTYTGNGFMTAYVDPNTMETGVRMENSVDNRVISPRFRGLRIGVSGMAANSAGASTTIHDPHFHNYNQDGSMYAHAWLGGKNRIESPYLDGPTKYGYIWEGDDNDVLVIQHFHNPGSTWFARDNFAITHRSQSGASGVRVWGGIEEGGAATRIFADHVGPGAYSPMAGLTHLFVSHFPDSILTPRADPRFYAAIQPIVDPTVQWAIDNTVTTMVIAQAATADLQTGSGVISLTETQATGFSALLVAGNAGIAIVGNNATANSTFVNSLAPGAGTIGFAVTGNRIRIKNNYGSQITICLSGVRTRAVI